MSDTQTPCPHPDNRRVHAHFKRARKPSDPISGWYCLGCGVNLADAAVTLDSTMLEALRIISEAAHDVTARRRAQGAGPDA